jgi:S-adenosylmethionine synthetase
MFKTAESVSPGHPDKMCDQISDAILDACLVQDPLARVAIETVGGHGSLVVIGELTTTAFVDVNPIAKRICWENIGVLVNIVQQSPEIAQGVDTGGAGDQGIMVGYATRETPNYMPLEYELARRLNEYLWKLHPNDGKTQVTLDVTEDSKQWTVNRVELVAIVVSWCGVSQAQLHTEVSAWLDTEVLIKHLTRDAVKLHLNPAGDWNIGWFTADTGLTGRKLAVDNYGPRVPIGGGAFSGKDPTKVDRSAAYKARQMAVKLLEEKGANEVMVQIAYAIGYRHPVSCVAWIDGVAENQDILRDDLTPQGIITSLDLCRPIYEQTARYGHFGRGYMWG